MTVILVDDEILALKRLEVLISDYKDIQILGSFQDEEQAVSQINNLNPDVVFLDVNLKNSTCFELIERFKVNPLIVFVTAHDKYAIRAFEHFAIDFLLKPFKDERFYKTIDRAIQLHNVHNEANYTERLSSLMNYIKTEHSNGNSKRKIPIKIGNRVQLISIDEIKYITASGYYAEIFTERKKYVLRESIKNLIQSLEPYNFARIHRSTIVNIDFIDELVYSNYGELDVKMKDSKLYRVSKSCKKAFFNKIGV